MVYLRSLDDQIQIRIDDGQPLVLGRTEQCDVYLDDPSVSSMHARVSLEDGRLRIDDLGSTNGTRVNYLPLTEPGLLQDGDTLEFGNLSFVVDAPGLEAPEEDVEGPMEAVVDLDPVEDDRSAAETTMNIAVPPEPHMVDEEGESGAGDASWIAFAAAFVMIAAAGGLLYLRLCTLPSPY